MIRLWIIALALLIAAAPAIAAENVAVPSATPASLPDYLAHKGPPVTVSGELYLPAGTGPFPAMILKHGSAGLVGVDGDNIRGWAKMLAGWGVAALVLDSFTARGIKDTFTNQNQLSTWAEMEDAFAALKVLAADPRIDPARIGIAGWSRGGSIAFNTALETTRHAALGDAGPHFALHIAFFGVAETQYRDTATDHAPVLFLHGAADNYVPMAATQEFADWLKSMGNPVTFVAYPKAYHNFDVANGYNGYFKQLQVGGHCDMVVNLPDASVIRLGHKPVSNPAPAELAAYFKGCVTHGANVGYNAAARTDAVARVHAFLTANFHLAG